MNCLLFAPRPVTAEELKCYKSMEAYIYFLCGWVKELSTLAWLLQKIPHYLDFSLVLIKKKKHYCLYVKQLQGQSFLQLIEKGSYMQVNASKYF